jgi:hypothetical protein
MEQTIYIIIVKEHGEDYEVYSDHTDYEGLSDCLAELQSDEERHPGTYEKILVREVKI